MKPRPKLLPLEKRLFARLIIDPSGCVLWTGAVNRGGYGRITVDHVSRSVHRVMYELLAGPIPDGLDLDHLCRTRNCANVAHLEPVTRRENVLRGTSIQAVNARKDRCDQGHLFNSANTYWYRGMRLCRPCNRDAVRRYKAAKKGTQ